MKKLCTLTFFLIFAILLTLSASAQYETIAGIEEASGEYESYKLCIDSCAQCELNCKQMLLEQTAETKQDESFCLQLTDEARKTFCLDNTYRIKAFSQKDKTICDKISNEDEQKRCALSVQIEKAIEKESEAECNSLPEDFIESCKTSFYYTLATQKQDESYCDKLEEPMKADCISSVESRESMAIAQAAETPETTTETTGGEEGQPPTTMVKTNLMKIAIYIGIAVVVIIIIISGIFIIRKMKKPKEEAPLVVQRPEEKPAEEAR